ncbi:MAG: ATP-binding cassette domain-containing protein [Treponemataceae bacterium]|nr:ATP-binding cassette domain-containing protein [Treponemataceae bacterium]
MRYAVLTALLRWVSLACTIAVVFAVTAILSARGDGIAVPLACIAAAAACSAAAARAASFAEWKTSCQVKKSLRSMMYRKLLRLGSGYQEHADTARIVQLAADGVEQLELWFSQYLPQLLYCAAAVVTTFSVLALISARMAVILLACVPLIPLAIAGVQGVASRILGTYWNQYASLADSFLENVQGLTTLLIYRADGFKQRQMQEESERFRRVTMKVLSMQLNSIVIMDVVAYAGAGLGILAAVSAFRSGALSMERCFAAILISADFFIPLRRLGSCFHTAMNGMAAARNIFSFLDVGERPAGTAEVPAAPDSRGNVFSCRNAGCSFGGRTALSGMDIDIPKGSFTAFVGESGSGKSTAAKILSGIQQDYSGSATVNGLEVRECAPESLHRFCSYISHRDWIFQGSVRDALLDAAPDASDGEMRAALEQVRLLDFLDGRDGLDTAVSEGAANLSGGQRQRLSLARALLHGSDVYIFDEATSNIDVESEEVILDVMRRMKGGRTVIMISHTAEACRGADRTYRFSDGTVSILEGA